MKQFFLAAILVVSSISAFCQVIDSSNYCSFYNMNAHYSNAKVKITTTFLSKLEVAEIVYDEMKNLGFDYLFNFRIVQIDSMTHVNAICYSGKSNIGFLFEESHGMVPEQANRYVISRNKDLSGFAYCESIVTINGDLKFIKVFDLPSNLYILKMENYWYQESDDSKTNEILVSREFIINLLREDIRRIAPMLEVAQVTE